MPTLVNLAQAGMTDNTYRLDCTFGDAQPQGWHAGFGTKIQGFTHME